MLNKLELIKQMLQSATPGPWRYFDTDDGVPDYDVRVCYSRDGNTCEWCIALSGDTINGAGEKWTPETLERWRNDAKFIAAAPESIAWLIAELETAQKKLHKG